MLPIVLAAVFLYAFDQNVVNIALPTLPGGPVALELVVAGYAFAYASGLVTGGRLGDLLGYRRMFLLGTTAFTAASLLCGLAGGPGTLVAARLLQGLTAAAMVPQVLALITTAFPPAERTTALAWFGVTGGLSGVAGQVLGGFLLDADLAGYGWRVLFLINVPIGAVVLVLATRLLPPGGSGRRPALDLPGVAGVSAGVALALLPLIFGRTTHWAGWIWPPLALAVPVVALTLRHEARVAGRGGSPLIDLTLFRSRRYVAGLGIAAAFMAFFTSSIFVTSLLLQSGFGLSPLRAGLAFTPFSLIAILTALVGRRTIARYGAARVIRAGCVISAAGLVSLLATVNTARLGAGVPWLAAELALVGAGNSMILTAYLGAALAGVRPDQAGVASGMLNTIQQFAGSAGLAAVGAAFFAVLGEGTDRSRYAPAVTVALAAGLALVATIAALSRLLDHMPKGAPRTAPIAWSEPSISTCAASRRPNR